MNTTTDANAILAAQWVTEGFFGEVSQVVLTDIADRYAVTTTDGRLFFVMVEDGVAYRVS